MKPYQNNNKEKISISIRVPYLDHIALFEQGWLSGENTRLPPMCPGFDSRTRRHTWVEFVVGSRPYLKGFSSGTLVLPSQMF